MALGELMAVEGIGLFSMETAGEWFVLHTKSRQEKALGESLASMGVRHYLPLRKMKRVYGGRKAVVEMPLFSGYLFMRGAMEDAYRADRTGRVAQVIRVVDQAKLAWELRNIELATARDLEMNPYPGLVRGVKVRVMSGAMAGIEGIVEDKTKRDRLMLQVDVLGQATSLEIDGAVLERVE